MLHRTKLLKELQAVSHDLFMDLSPELSIARKVWKTMITDPDLALKIVACQAPWPLPVWEGPIDKTVAVAPFNKPYQLLSVDGSQVYPDKHQGTSCFLINIGVVELQYGTGKKGTNFKTIPFVFTDRLQELDLATSGSVDVVNCKREELELQFGLESAIKLKKESEEPLLFLFDGSLIFWHLEAKEQNLKKHFLKRYCDQLVEYKKNNIWIAGYISLPKSKELIGIVRTILCGFNTTSKEYKKIDHLVDASLARFFLQPGTRSTIFKSRSPVTEHYPPEVAPYFFYFDVGAEIVRIELPQYLAQNEAVLAQICGIILDQVQKGTGFPVGVAEAHEQAVVRGPDREFFYHLIEKLGIAQKRSILLSQKSRKKRGIAI